MYGFPKSLCMDSRKASDHANVTAYTVVVQEHNKAMAYRTENERPYC